MSNVTLYSYCKALPAFGGRVFMDAVPKDTAFPYAIVWDAQGGVTNTFYGTSNVLAVYPSVIVYEQQLTTDTSNAAARARTLGYLDSLRAAKDAVNLHSDGLTPFLPGSVQLVIDGTPTLDDAATGRYRGTLRFSAQLYRS